MDAHGKKSHGVDKTHCKSGHCKIEKINVKDKIRVIKNVIRDRKTKIMDLKN